MIGVFRVAKSELSADRIGAYRAAHCAVCKSISKYYGSFSSLFMPHESTFLLLLGLAYSNEKNKDCKDVPVIKVPCTALPFWKVPSISIPESTQRVIGAFSVIGAYAALDDHARDEDSVAASWALRRMSRKLEGALRLLNIIPMGKGDPRLFSAIVDKHEWGLEDLLSAYRPNVASIWFHGMESMNVNLPTRHLHKLSNVLSDLMILIDAVRDAAADKNQNKPNPIHTNKERIIAEQMIEYKTRELSLLLISAREPWVDILQNIIKRGVFLKLLRYGEGREDMTSERDACSVSCVNSTCNCRHQPE